MRMYFDALMDRPVTKEHYISPGIFEFNFNGKSVRFDFSEVHGGKDMISKDPRAVTFELRDLDTVSFPEADILYNEKYLKNIDEIEEFSVYTGEENEPEINLEKILFISFSLNNKDYDVPNDVIEEYNKVLADELRKKDESERGDR